MFYKGPKYVSVTYNHFSPFYTVELVQHRQYLTL